MMRIILVFLSLLPYLVLADERYSPAGVGLVAGNLIEPVSILSNFVGSGSIIIGMTALFGSLLKYMQHRVNPLVAPISTVILLLVIGIILVCLPLAYKLTSSGIPYDLHL